MAFPVTRVGRRLTVRRYFANAESVREVTRGATATGC